VLPAFFSSLDLAIALLLLPLVAEIVFLLPRMQLAIRYTLSHISESLVDVSANHYTRPLLHACGPLMCSIIAEQIVALNKSHI